MRPHVALCLGCAESVWDDVQRLERQMRRPWDGLVIATNEIGAFWQRELSHWVSLHPEKMPGWFDQRREMNGHLMHFRTWGPPPRWPTENYHPDTVLDPWIGGSSGMLAVQVAIHLGCSRVVLCGIPMAPTKHFGETKEDRPSTWGSADIHWRAWTRYASRMKPWCRSMSGRTAELFGTPTEEWLNG